MAQELDRKVEPLKFLFEAVYKDGTIYTQGAEDSSLFVEGKNAFFDIYYQPFKPLEDLVEFRVTGTETNNTFSVNVQDGSFAVNGLRFEVGEPLPDPKAKRRLIFFKRHFHHFNVGMEQKGHEIQYHIGWQTTIKGKNYQQTINVM